MLSLCCLVQVAGSPDTGPQQVGEGRAGGRTGPSHFEHKSQPRKSFVPLDPITGTSSHGVSGIGLTLHHHFAHARSHLLPPQAPRPLRAKDVSVAPGDPQPTPQLRRLALQTVLQLEPNGHRLSKGRQLARSALPMLWTPSRFNLTRVFCCGH